MTVIRLVGTRGSGKTTITNKLMSRFDQRHSLLDGLDRVVGTTLSDRRKRCRPLTVFTDQEFLDREDHLLQSVIALTGVNHGVLINDGTPRVREKLIELDGVRTIHVDTSIRTCVDRLGCNNPASIQSIVEEDEKIRGMLQRMKAVSMPQSTALASCLAELCPHAWIGVDFDGTLCDEKLIPRPIMIDVVRSWLSVGMQVRVVTARVNSIDYDLSQMGEQKDFITRWLIKYLGEALPVQSCKSAGMIELWDDKGVRVDRGTGVVSSDNFMNGGWS